MDYAPYETIDVDMDYRRRVQTVKGKAAVFYHPGVPFEIREFDLPDPEEHAALIQVTAAGICGSDLHLWRGDFPEAIYRLAPEGHAFGHEMTGIIARLGKGLQKDALGQPLREGDRVCFPYFYPCGRCPQCRRGHLAACPQKQRRPALRVARPWNGAFSEYYYLRSDHFLYKVPDDLPTELVATLNCALAQVLYAFQVIKVEAGDTVVIQGAGTLGLYAIAAARFAGAHQIIAIDGNAFRLALATKFRADHIIDIGQLQSASDRIAHVFGLTAGQGADLVVDMAGVPAVIPEGLSMLRSGGRYLEIGCIGSRQHVVLDPSQLVFGSLCLQGVYQYHPEIIPQAFAFLRQNQHLYPFEQLITHRFPLALLNEAFLFVDGQRASALSDPCMRAIVIP